MRQHTILPRDSKKSGRSPVQEKEVSARKTLLVAAEKDASVLLWWSVSLARLMLAAKPPRPQSFRNLCRCALSPTTFPRSSLQCYYRRAEKSQSTSVWSVSTISSPCWHETIHAANRLCVAPYTCRLSFHCGLLCLYVPTANHARDFCRALTIFT